jgi:hypothetical protein
MILGWRGAGGSTWCGTGGNTERGVLLVIGSLGVVPVVALRKDADGSTEGGTDGSTKKGYW